MSVQLGAGRADIQMEELANGSTVGKNLDEQIDELVEKVNQFVVVNYILRAIIREEMEKFCSEKLMVWINDPEQKWQDLPDEEAYKFALPKKIDSSFRMLRETIEKGHENAPDPDKDRFVQQLIDKIKDRGKGVTPTNAEYYKNLGLTEAPEDDLKNAIESVLSARSVQLLDDAELNDRFDQFWKAMEEGASNSVLIGQKLEEIFGMSSEDARRTSPGFEKGDPFKLKLAEVLINSFKTCEGRILCYFDDRTLRSFKIDRAERRSGTKAEPLFILNGSDGAKAFLKVVASEKTITDVTWEQKITVKLSEFIERIKETGPRELKIELIHDMFPKLNLYLEPGSYQVQVKQQRQFKKDGSFEEFIFTSRIDGKNDSVFRVYSNNPTCFYIPGFIGKTVPIPFDSFMSCYNATGIEETKIEIKQEYQGKIYLTTFEPETNDKIAKELKKCKEAQQGAVKSLVLHDLHHIYHLLIEKGKNKDLLGEEGELFCLMYKIVDDNAELKKHLIDLCSCEKIVHRSKEEALVLLNLIHLANFQQLSPGVRVSNHPQLIEMLGKSLEQSGHLRGKRGLILLGSTGCGKTTATCYLMGIKMKTSQNRFGETIVEAEASEKQVKNLPKIGFSLGISKTVLAEGFKLHSLEEKKGTGRVQTSVSVNFPAHITPDAFSIVDFPGFQDTRGTEFEIVTNFNVDHSIKALDAIDGIGLVISYDTVTASRSGLFIAALRDLSYRFYGCIGENKPDLEKRIFILITKQPPGIKIGELKERGLQLLAEEENQPNPDPMKLHLLQFFVRQCSKDRVILMTPTIPLHRIDILNRILESPQGSDTLRENTLKNYYSTSLTDLNLKIKFSDVVYEAIAIWSEVVFPQFLESTKETVENAGKIFLQTQKDIKNKTNNIEEIERDNQRRQEEIKKDEKMLEVLKEALQEAALVLPDKIAKEIKENQENITAIITQRVEGCEKEREQISKTCADCKKEADEQQKELEKLLKQIEDAQKEIDEKTTGVSPQHLYDRSYKEGDNIRVQAWKSGPLLDAKKKRAIDKGTDELSEGEEGDWKTEERSLKDTFTIVPIAKIDRTFQLIPSGQGPDALNDLIKGEHTLILGNGGFKIEIESCKVKFDYIRHHRDGKRICYGYEAMFDGKPPYPRLKITHIIANSALYVSEVDALKNRIAILEGKKSACCTIKAKQETQLNHAQEEQKKVQKRLEDAMLDKERLESTARGNTISSFIQSYKEQLDQKNNLFKNNAERIKQLGSEIDTLEQDEKKYQSNLMELEFERQRWALLIRSHAQQINHSLEMAEFFAEFGRGKTETPNPIDKKLAEAAEKCKRFLEDYKRTKKKLEEEIDAVLPQLAPFKLSDRVSVEQKVLRCRDFGQIHSQSAMDEGKSAVDRLLAPDRKLTEYVNEAQGPVGDDLQQPHWSQTDAIDEDVALALHLSLNADRKLTEYVNEEAQGPVGDDLQQPHWPQTDAIDEDVALAFDALDLQQDSVVESTHLSLNAERNM